MERFGHFLASPFFFQGKKVEEVLSLYHYLKPHYPSFSHPRLAKAMVFAHVFPGEEFRERKFKHLMTKTNKALEQYISICYRDKIFAEPPEELSFIAFYREKKMPEQFQKAYQKATAEQASRDVKDIGYFWTDYLLAKEKAEQESIFNRRKTDLNLPETLSRLDHFYLVSALASACVFLSQKKYQVPLESKGSLAILEACLPLLKAGYYREEPLIDMLYKTYLLLQEESTEADFRALKIQYDQHAMQIALNLRQIIHGVLRNFCSHQLNEGKEKYLAELFFLYRKGLSQGVLDSGGGLLPSSFGNMITLAIKLEKFVWAKQFLEDYRYRVLGMKQPEAIYQLNRANLLFAQAQFDEALNCLTFDFEDIYFKLVARRLEVQIYYELQSPLLESKIQAFKVFVFRISKSRLTALQRQGYTNFIDLLRQIVHPSTRYNRKRIASLQAKLKAKKTIAEKHWLLKKLEDL